MPLSLEARLRNFQANRPAPPEPKPLVQDLLDGIEITDTDGAYYLISRDYPDGFILPSCDPERLKRNLRLLHGVGPRTEEKLRSLGFDSLEELLAHDRWAAQAEEILRAIAVGDLRRLRRRGAHDRDMLSFFAPEDLVFIDLETTGLYSTLPLFLVGLLFMQGGKLQLRQFLARRFDEERSLLAAVARELPRFKMIVSYNGLTFDLPYLTGRFLAHRLPCRLDHLHIDLLRHARRKYRGCLPDCRLTTVETAVLCQDARTEDMPGYLIPELYHQFVKTQDQNIIKGIVEHNAQDLLSLARLIQMVE